MTTNVRSDWKSVVKIFFLLTLINCVTYKPFGIIISKGARLRTDCGYQESNNLFDVKGIYVKNARIKPLLHKLTYKNGKTRHDNMVFNLVKGESIILLLWGRYVPYPGTTAHAYEQLGLFIGLDSIISGDTIFFNKDNTQAVFYFDRFYDMLHHTGYTKDMDGYLLIDSIYDDTISGIVDFDAETKGYYSTYQADQSIRDTVDSWVGCEIEFKATLEKVKKDSVVVGHVLLDLYYETESDN
jgi:hypothetical protein